jgi:transmembrane sensor
MDLSHALGSGANILPFTRPDTPSRRTVLTGGAGAIAASLAAWMVAKPPMDLWPSLADLTADHRTDVGERKAFAPAPGVAVELNALSAMSVADRGRGMRLIDGEAFVRVSGPQAELFAIATANGRFVTRQGSVNIRTSARGACVTCLSGAVDQVASGPPLRLAAGQQATSQPGGGWRVASADPQIAVAWRRGLLIFHETPLGDAVEAINRYRRGKIIVASRALAERPVDGIFHADQAEDAVEQIQQFLHVRVTRLPGGVVVMA